jgi:hypothetical protein
VLEHEAAETRRSLAEEGGEEGEEEEGEDEGEDEEGEEEDDEEEPATSAAAARSSQPAPKKVLPGMQVEYASPLEGRTKAGAARARAGRPLSLAAVL